jgi:SAM-dependent methyltransferase
LTKKSDTFFINELMKMRKVSGKVLIVGSKLYKNSYDRKHWYDGCEIIGVDIAPGNGVDLVHNMEIPIDIGLFDHIDCCSVLEHCEKPWLVAENIENIMKPGSTILLSVPFAWRVHGYPDDYWRMTDSAVRSIFPKISWDVLCYHSGGKKQSKPLGIKSPIGIERTEVSGIGEKI